MGKPRLIKTWTRLAIIVTLTFALVLPIMASGCGASSPDQAVNNFYKAIEARNWDAYLNTIYPDNVRRMTESDALEQKKQFQEADFKYTGLKFKTVADKKDPNKAGVELTAGTITGTNPTTNKRESTTIDEIKKSYNVTPTINVRRYKGSWYVDVPMASVDRPTQQLQQ